MQQSHKVKQAKKRSWHERSTAHLHNCKCAEVLLLHMLCTNAACRALSIPFIAPHLDVAADVLHMMWQVCQQHLCCS
jgi:hypothetical protein